MKRHEDKRSISIRNSMIIIFILSIIISVTAIGSMVFTNWRSSAKETAEIISEDMNNEMFKQIDSLLNIPEHINEVNQKLIYNNIVDITNEKEREKFFVGVLQIHGNEIFSLQYHEVFFCSKTCDFQRQISCFYGICAHKRINALVREKRCD